MKKIFILFSIIIFLLGLGGLFLNGVILAQYPSFEVYSNQNCSCECGSLPANACSCPAGINCTPYPTVENVNVTEDGDLLIITAEVNDVSGVSSVVAKIEDTNEGTDEDNQKRSLSDLTKNMSCVDCDDLGNGTYQATFSIESTEPWVDNQTYYVEIFTVDRLFNSSNVCRNEYSGTCSDTSSCPCYWRIKSFETGEEEIKNTNIYLKLVNLDLTPFGNCFDFFSDSRYEPFPHCIPDDTSTLIEAYSDTFTEGNTTIWRTPIVLWALLEDEYGNRISNQTITFIDKKY